MSFRNAAGFSSHSLWIIPAAFVALVLWLMCAATASAEAPFTDDDLEGLTLADAGAIAGTSLERSAVLAVSADVPFADGDLEGLTMADAGAIARTSLELSAVPAVSADELFTGDDLEGLTMADAGAIAGTSLGCSTRDARCSE